MKTSKNNKLTHSNTGSRWIESVARNLTIKHKLVLIIMLVCVTSLIIAGAIFTAYEWSNLRQFMVMNLSAQAEIIAETTKAAVAFDDADDAKETLSSLNVQSSIVFGGIYDGEGYLMAAYYRYGEDKRVQVQPQSIRDDGYKFSSDHITVYKRIILDGDVIGTVCIRGDLEPLRAMLVSGVKITLIIMLVSLVSAYVMSSRLQSVVSRPIIELTELARVISEKKDYSVRGIKLANDEIGLLIGSFNDMLDQIQQRDRALVDSNKQLEGKVDQRTKDLEEMVQKLNQSNEQLAQFTYIASHDLREPMRKISSFGQLLTDSLEGKLDEDDRENLDFMIDGANRMQQMIEAMLAYSRVTTRGVEFEPLDLNEIVEELHSFELAVALEETNARLNIPEPLLCVNGDPTQIRQLLQNLIANGLKYQKEGTTPEITVRTTLRDNMVRVEVEDNGIGIKEDQFENVFVMFKRLHSRGEYEGTGIGLAVCKKIVERHGGTIGVSSTYGEGCTFWFTVPIASTVDIDNEIKTESEMIV